MIPYDNLEDVKVKLYQTMCYYDGNAVLVKQVQEVEPKTFLIDIYNVGSRAKRQVFLNDKLFNYMEFNLGYCNYDHESLWWYRYPNRQYRQGLKNDQMGSVTPRGNYHGIDFTFCNPVVSMLENKYPKLDELEKPLRDGNLIVRAFHKDFAATWDNVHQDFVIEYKGAQVGSMTPKRDVKFLSEFNHLNEVFREVVG